MLIKDVDTAFLANVSLGKDSLLLDNEVNLIDSLKKKINIVHGQARFIHPFGNFIGHCEVEDCHDMKSIRCDFYVVCSTYHFPWMTRYIKLTAPLLRCPVNLAGWTPD